MDVNRLPTSYWLDGGMGICLSEEDQKSRRRERDCPGWRCIVVCRLEILFPRSLGYVAYVWPNKLRRRSTTHHAVCFKACKLT
jgi:hypothetical protein